MAVATQQPVYPQQQMQQVVVVQGARTYNKDTSGLPKEFTSGVFGCCDDIGTCWPSFFCEPCMLGWLSGNLNLLWTNQERSMDTAVCLLSTFFGCYIQYWTCDVRQRFAQRYEFANDSGCCTNCMLGVFCPNCAMAQVAREFKHRGDWKGTMCSDPSPAKDYRNVVAVQQGMAPGPAPMPVNAA